MISRVKRKKRMSDIITLALKYIKNDKKRSVLTIIGIALSVALLCSTTILGVSIDRSWIESLKDTNGRYHAVIHQLDSNMAQKVDIHTGIEKTGRIVSVGSTNIESKGINIYFEGWDENTFELFNYQLLRGRMPQNAYELVVEEWILKELNSGLEMGDSYTFNIFYEYYEQSQGVVSMNYQYEFTIVGILKNRNASQITGNTKAIFSYDSVEVILPPESIFISVPLVVKDGFAIRDTVKEIEKNMTDSYISLSYNAGLILALEDYSEMKKEYVFLALLIMLVTITAIYNIFHISILERIRHFGLLRSVGATPGQICHIVILEALFLCVASIPIGVIIGIGIVKIIVDTVSIFEGAITQIAVPGWVFLWTTGVCFLSVMISAYIPAKTASKVSPLEAISSDRSVLKESSPTIRRWHKILVKLTGIGGKMAYQNLWRYKKRFVISVVSMSIGVILFIVFSYFVEVINPDNIIKTNFLGEYVINLRSTVLETGYTQNDLELIENIDGVTNVYASQQSFAILHLSKKDINKYYLDYIKNEFNYEKAPDFYGMYNEISGFFGYSGNALGIAEESLVEGRIDIENMAVKPVILLVNTFPSKEGGINITNYKVGDEIMLEFVNRGGSTRSSRGEEQVINKQFPVIVGGILNKNPFPSESNIRGLNIVMHIDMFHSITDSNSFKRFDIVVNDKMDRTAIEQNLEQITEKFPQGVMITLEQEIENFIRQKMQITILMNSLIGIIVLISVLSIMNTINTNLLLRTKEFGVLRAIGISNRQLRWMLHMEGFYYGLISSIIGCFVGVVLAYILYILISSDNLLIEWSVPWMAIVVAFTASILIGVSATILPFYRSKRVTVISMLR